MKDSSISIAPTPTFNPMNQCLHKKPYSFKRRAQKAAHTLAQDYPEFVFTVYECPHCGKFHVGKVRQE